MTHLEMIAQLRAELKAERERIQSLVMMLTNLTNEHGRWPRGY